MICLRSDKNLIELLEANDPLLVGFGRFVSHGSREVD